MDQMNIGKLISKKRKEKGYTQNQLGELLGVSGKTISRWETAKYMPDLSMLIPLSEQLEISVYELLKGEETHEVKVNQNEIVQSIIEYSNHKKLKIEFDKWTKLMICIVTSITLFVGYDLIKYTPHRWYNGYKEDLIKWQEEYEDIEAYEMAFSSKTNRPVFKYPFKALAQIKNECSKAIEYIQKNHVFFPLSKYNYDAYGRWGRQIYSETMNSEIREQGLRLSHFMDIFENSFE